MRDGDIGELTPSLSTLRIPTWYMLLRYARLYPPSLLLCVLSNQVNRQGMYTNSWDPNPGAIIRSKDRGNTWASTDLPFKVGGNMPGRGTGERLAVDPKNSNILYFGARSGNGLWKSTDAGVTWAKV